MSRFSERRKARMASPPVPRSGAADRAAFRHAERYNEALPDDDYARLDKLDGHMTRDDEISLDKIYQSDEDFRDLLHGWLRNR